jgi:hypothetical protein
MSSRGEGENFVGVKQKNPSFDGLLLTTFASVPGWRLNARESQWLVSTIVIGSQCYEPIALSR